MIANRNKKNSVGGWMSGWMERLIAKHFGNQKVMWEGGWVGVKAVLRIAHRSPKEKTDNIDI